MLKLGQLRRDLQWLMTLNGMSAASQANVMEGFGFCQSVLSSLLNEQGVTAAVAKLTELSDLVYLGPPETLTVVRDSGTQATLTIAAVDGATGYEVYRGGVAEADEPDMMVKIATGEAGPTYVDSTVLDGEEYAYRCSAVDGEGEGFLSPVAIA